jgi:arsenite methyltransferase
MVANERLDYGLDTPGFFKALAILAVVTAAAAVILGATGFSVFSFIVGVICAVWIFCAAFLFIGSKFLKLRARDLILSRISWRGDERVLDVGCGHGLLLIGAAKRLTTGRAVGIDLWRQVDQYDNRPESTMRNARIEGVAGRVELHTGDARKLEFPDESFDLVVSSAALHDIAQNTAERYQALRGIIRVLKPGGRVAIYDIYHVPEYQQILLESGMERVQVTGCLRWYLPFASLLTAIKPGRTNA